MYLVHWPDVNTSFEETMRALDDIVEQGKARHIGVSNFRLAQLEACMRLRRVDVVQYGWNMFDRACRRRSSRIVPRSRWVSWPMGHWPMACSPAPSTPACSLTKTIGAPALARWVSSICFGPSLAPTTFRNLRAVEELKALAAEYHKTLPQFALRWTTSHPVISVALVGCRQPVEVEENLGALGWAISEADMAAIDAIFARHNAVTMPAGWLEDA